MAELREFVSGEALLWLRMSDDDLKRYGGPEWVSFDAGDLFNAPASQLEAYEREIRFPIHLLLVELPTYGSRATRAALFIARRLAGVKTAAGLDEAWDDFDPHTMQTLRRAKPDAGPDTEPSDPGKSRSRAKNGASPGGSEVAASPKSSTKSVQS